MPCCAATLRRSPAYDAMQRTLRSGDPKKDRDRSDRDPNKTGKRDISSDGQPTAPGCGIAAATRLVGQKERRRLTRRLFAAPLAGDETAVEGTGAAMLCTDLVKVKHFPDHLVIEPLRCRRWSCDYCVPWLQKRVKAIAIGGKATTFLTLTVSPATASDNDEAARILVVAWRKLRIDIMRRCKVDHVPFFVVFEATKRGRPHLHILARMPYVDQSWLSDRMAHHARAPIVDIRYVNSPDRAASYVAKYLGKAPHRFKGCKRYWRSQDWEKVPYVRKPLDPAGLWKVGVLRRSFTDVMHDLVKRGACMVLGDEAITISHRDWSRAMGGWP